MDKYIKLPKLGYVKAKVSMPVVGKINNATIEYIPSGKYFCVLNVECEDVTENEIWDAKIVAVLSIRENNVDFEGKNDLGDVVTVDMSNISTATSAKSK